MKEEECESVTELKSKSVKNSILEAMAKYKQNKLQMEKDKMMENCKTKPEVEKPKEEVKSITPKESELGITEYVHQGEGFSAVVKQRYSDFQVHEIDVLGNVVHLTDQTLPVKLVEDDSLTEEQLNSLSKEEWDSIENLVQDTTAEGAAVEFDVTSKSKEERSVIHKAIRKKYKGITTDSSPALDGKTVMKVRKYKSVNEKRDTRNTWTGPPYLQFVLYKENTSTMDAISNIARRTKIRPAMFLTAGTKDKRAITCQLVTVKHGDPKQLLNALANENRIAIGNFTFTDTPLQLGHLKGNRFRLVLRNVLAEESLVEAKLNSLKENGFINYYGAQRFGTRHVPTHVIGKSLLLGKWQEAVNLILSPPPTKPNFRFGADLYMAQLEYKSSKNADKAFNKINRSVHTVEGQLLFNLKKFNTDLVGALNTIPRNLRLTYIHAYQSLIWNKVVSKRVKKYGLVPIVGDLVYAPGSSETEIDSSEIDYEVIPDVKEVEPEKDADQDSNQRAQRNQRKVIAIDSETINNYTIYDVLLPLPGYDITYPTNEVAGWYTELLEADGLGDKGLKHTVKAYNLGGAYRLLMSKPQDVEWKFARYDNPTLSLVTSDWEKLGNIEPQTAVVEDGAFLSLILEFSLTSASYATMALREITKMEMSAEFQTTLNQAAANKKPIEGESQAEGEPENKRIKTEPDIPKNGYVSDAADAQPGGSQPIIDEGKATGEDIQIKLERV